jgi:hypothetical protein
VDRFRQTLKLSWHYSVVKSSSLLQIITRHFRKEPPLHPIDQKLAKRWIKQRLATVFPHLRGNPTALEQAYQALSLDPRPGVEEGEADTVFEMRAPWLP